MDRYCHWKFRIFRLSSFDYGKFRRDWIGIQYLGRYPLDISLTVWEWNVYAKPLTPLPQQTAYVDMRICVRVVVKHLETIFVSVSPLRDVHERLRKKSREILPLQIHLHNIGHGSGITPMICTYCNYTHIVYR